MVERQRQSPQVNCWPVCVWYGDQPETSRFVVQSGDRLSLYELAMVWCNRPPWSKYLGREDALREPDEAREWLACHEGGAETAVLRKLENLINSGELPAATILTDEQGTDREAIDVFRSTVEAGGALLALARARDEWPPHLFASPSEEQPPQEGEQDSALVAEILGRVGHGELPGSTIPWKKFCDDCRAACGGTAEGGRIVRGFSDKTIERIVKRVQAGNL